MKLSWDQAITEVGDKLLAIRKSVGSRFATYWLGSAKFNNEQSYLFRKFYAFWGTNNGDHQARICHSTTVAGVANTWGYGAMTNSDAGHPQFALRSSCSVPTPSEAHPVAMHAPSQGQRAE